MSECSNKVSKSTKTWPHILLAIACSYHWRILVVACCIVAVFHTLFINKITFPQWQSDIWEAWINKCLSFWLYLTLKINWFVKIVVGKFSNCQLITFTKKKNVTKIQSLARAQLSLWCDLIDREESPSEVPMYQEKQMLIKLCYRHVQVFPAVQHCQYVTDHAFVLSKQVYSCAVQTKVKSRSATYHRCCTGLCDSECGACAAYT